MESTASFLVPVGDSSSPNKPRTAAQFAAMIGQITGEPIDRVLEQLELERHRPGITVAEDFRRHGASPHVWGPAMGSFYSETQAFLYELAVWNRNRMKKLMRRFTAKKLAAAGRPLDVLCFGDGLGFDCLHLAHKGHRAVYFDLPGPSEQFARRLFSRDGAAISMVTDPQRIPANGFDAITCFDVLEHVPDPPQIVRSLASYLRPGGRLFVSAPFYMLFASYPTHLRSNRQYSGRLDLYTQAGLELAGGRASWCPLILRKPLSAGAAPPPPADATGRVRLSGLFQQLGRWTRWPFLPSHWLRWGFNRRFEES